MENLITVVKNICEITKNVQMVSFLQDINYKGPNHEDCKKQLELMEKHGLTEGPLYKVLQFRLTQEAPKPEPRPVRPQVCNICDYFFNFSKLRKKSPCLLKDFFGYEKYL